MNMLEREREQYANEGEPPMAWERYLEIAPALSGLDAEAREEALAARGLDHDLWSRAEGYWTLTLALDVQQGRADRADAYGAACVAALATRGDGDDDPLSEDTLPEAGALRAKPEAPALPSLPSLPPAPAAVAAPELTVPSFLRAPVAPAAEGWRRAPMDPGGPSYPRLVPPGPVAPSSSSAPPAPRARATLDLHPSAVAAATHGVLPFAAAPPEGAARLPPGPSTPASQSGATMDLTALHGAAREPDLQGRDRRTEAGTVEIDPAMLSAFFARKPPL